MGKRNPFQVSEDVDSSGVLNVLKNRKDRRILQIVAWIANSSGVREFAGSPTSIAKTCSNREGPMAPNYVTLVLQRMLEIGVFSELWNDGHLVVGRIADYNRLVEVGTKG